MRQEYIDYLRGFCILLVGYHYFLYEYEHYYLWNFVDNLIKIP